MTWTPLSRSKGQRSRSPGRCGWLYWQANMDIELVMDTDACMTYIVSPLAGLGAGILWGIPPTACFNCNYTCNENCFESHYCFTCKCFSQICCSSAYNLCYASVVLLSTHILVQIPHLFVLLPIEQILVSTLGSLSFHTLSLGMCIFFLPWCRNNDDITKLPML